MQADDSEEFYEQGSPALSMDDEEIERDEDDEIFVLTADEDTPEMMLAGQRYRDFLRSLS